VAFPILRAQLALGHFSGLGARQLAHEVDAAR
jgi:hypothetical protein